MGITYMEEKIKPRTIIPREISCIRVLSIGGETIALNGCQQFRTRSLSTRKLAGRWNESKSRWGSQIDKEKKEKRKPLEQSFMSLYIASVSMVLSPIQYSGMQNARAVEQARILAGCVKPNTRQGEKSRTAATTTGVNLN